MARIRTIKPEFPQSESIGRLSRDARLCFIMLWTILDDAGRSRASSRMLASLLYPYDDDAPKLMDGWLDELEREGCIRRYEVDGSKYLDCPKWLSHQKIDHASQSRLPAYSDNFAKPREGSRSLAPDLGPRTSTIESNMSDKSDLPVSRKPKAKKPYPQAFEEFWKAYPTDAGMAKFPAFKAWAALSEDEQREAIAGLGAFRAWVKAQGKDYRTLHAVNYLKQKRFEGLAATAQAVLTPEQIAENIDRRDRLLGRGKYAESEAA